MTVCFHIYLTLSLSLIECIIMCIFVHVCLDMPICMAPSLFICLSLSPCIAQGVGLPIHCLTVYLFVPIIHHGRLLRKDIRQTPMTGTFPVLCHTRTLACNNYNYTRDARLTIGTIIISNEPTAMFANRAVSFLYSAILHHLL